MRTTRIRLKNFLSHRDTDLDLSSVHGGLLICGPTGAGKSAIPSAILGAMFGQFPGTRADEYVTLGASDCQVVHEFTARGSLYRATWTRSLKSKAGRSDLQLAVRNGAIWTPLTGKGIEETRAKIRAIVGVDYETLVAGNFAMQEDAGRFADPPPMSVDGRRYTGASARIMILSQYLGLTAYAEWASIAAANARDLEKEASTLEAQLADVERQLEGRGDVITRLQEAEQLLRETRSQSAEADLAIESITRELAGLEATLPNARMRLAGFTEVRRGLAAKQQAQGLKHAKRTACLSLISRAETVRQEADQARSLDATLAERREALARLGADGKAAAERMRALDARRVQVEAALSGARTASDAATARLAGRPALAARVGLLEQTRTDCHLAALKVEGISEAITAQRARRDEILAGNAEVRQAIAAVDAQEAGIQGKVAGLVPLIEGHQARVAVMETVPCRGVADLPERCPLLAQARESFDELGPLRERHEALCRWRRPPLPEVTPTAQIEAILRGLEKDRAAAQAAVQGLETTLASLQSAQAELATLDEVAAGLPELQARVDAAESDLHAVSREAGESAKTLEALRSQYETDRDAIAALQAERALLEASVVLLPQLVQAEQELPGVEADLASLAEEIALLEASLQEEPQVAEAFRAAGERVQTLGPALAQQRAALEGSRRTEQDAIRQAAEARVTLQQLEALAAEQAPARERVISMRSQCRTLGTLGEFYRAAPLMIMENEALPSMEEEANRILAKVSLNGMRVRFETQRALKTRDELVDGLEIIVTDQAGERSLACYSGGQRFQVHLALRIALAKLQARRAGASIETLVIDEGFGSQSAEALDGVIQALRAVQDEFPLLLIISHVESLRDVFPARIEMTGGPLGSTATLVTA